MKKRIPCIILAVLLILGNIACTPAEPSPYEGLYNALGYSYLGFELEADGDYIDLQPRGKAKIVLMGEEYSAKWKYEEDVLTVKQGGTEYYGKIIGEVIELDFSDMLFSYLKDGAGVESLCKAYGHESTEANQQDEGVCLVCGEVTEEILPAEMEINGITDFIEMGVVYPYTTLTTKELPTTGECEVISYEIIPSGEEYPAKEGYEWRVVTFELTFFDDNAKKGGYSAPSRLEDYYNTTLHDDTIIDDDAGMRTHTIRFHGEEMEAYSISSYEHGKWYTNQETKRKEVKSVYTYALCAPIGYDGGVFGVYDASLKEKLEDPDEWYIHECYEPEKYLLFRMD